MEEYKYEGETTVMENGMEKENYEKWTTVLKKYNYEERTTDALKTSLVCNLDIDIRLNCNYNIYMRLDCNSDIDVGLHYNVKINNASEDNALEVHF